MYDNVGGKIKGFARGLFFVESVCAIIGSIVLLADGDILGGLLCLFAGPCVALVSSWLLYGYGEQIEDIQLLRKRLVGETPSITHAPKELQSVAKQQASIPLPADVQKQKGHAWDHWNEEDSSIGTCDICGKTKQFLLHVEFDDSHGPHQKYLCYGCFSQRDCRPIGSK